MFFVGFTGALCLGAAGSFAGERRALDHHATVLNGRLVGSAFQLSEGIAITNAHVVKGKRPGANVRIIPSHGSSAGIDVPVLAVSTRMDMAILGVPKDFLTTVGGGMVNGRAGDRVIAAGVDASAVGTGNARREASGRIITPRANIGDFGPGLIVQLAGARPGFSGGPLLDLAGRLVGMVTAIRPATSGVAVKPTAASGFAPVRQKSVSAQEAYVLRADEIRVEVSRLMQARR